MQKAVTNVIEEKAHLEQYNRFKELQEIYSQTFMYDRREVEVIVRCKATYYPMEAKIDRESFENMLKIIQPRVLILVNGFDTKHN